MIDADGSVRMQWLTIDWDTIRAVTRRILLLLHMLLLLLLRIVMIVTRIAVAATATATAATGTAVGGGGGGCGGHIGRATVGTYRGIAVYRGRKIARPVI